MTVIVGIADDRDKVYLGADSAGSNGYSITSGHVKMFEGKGGIYYGCTSSFRMIDILQHIFDPYPYPAEGEDIWKWMCSSFSNKLRECFKDNGYLTKKDEQEIGGTFLCVVKGNLFRVQDDFSVLECPEGYAAVGSGQYHSYGALYATKDMKDTEERIRRALLAACTHCTTVSDPIVVKKVF